MRNVDQEVNVLGVPGTSPQHERQATDERVADRPGVERLGERFDGKHGVVGQEIGFSGHGGDELPGCCAWRETFLVLGILLWPRLPSARLVSI